VTNKILSSYADIQPSYDLTSDHFPIIATISTAVVIRKPTPRLHNAKTNWETYRQIIQEKAKLSIKIKYYKHIELETNNVIKVLQNAAKEATPNSDFQNTINNIPYEVKKLIAEKRKARSTWQRTHTPDSRRRYN
jgi:tRNA U34 5-carboxymethylaminomethyl modifying enzyme MnmG/GidA